MGKPIPPEMAKQIADHVFAGNKITAIKLYREHSGEGLKESKDFVEAMETELRAREPGKFTARPAGKGCLGMIALCGLGTMGFLLAAVAWLR
jgi:hypothetical protein